MLKIAHRINTVAQLKDVPPEYGVEIDIRYSGDELILHHDPFVEGEKFHDWLRYYRHKCIILNTKSEGLEQSILEMVRQHNVSNYFFLDLSIPFMIKQIRAGNRDIAVRFSEYEPLELLNKFSNLVEWVWVDCFSKLPLNDEAYDIIKKNFKICIVSPELQGHPLEWIEDFKKQLSGYDIDAVCTKRMDLW